MQKSELLTKAGEGDPKRFPRLAIGHKSNIFGGDDPTELRQTAGFRFAHARAITNDAWIINLRATV
jgi:hypothetical protein